MERGELRIYLGAAPGVGKTYALLDEAARRAARGADVVVAAIDTHDRPGTSAMLDSLARSGVEMTPVAYGLDVDRLVARRPDLVIVDELAGAAEAGGTTRHQAVTALLDAGIDVLTTLDIGQLESLGEIAERITGRPHGPLVPDQFVRAADQIHLVDQTPEALRRRLAHGNIYPPEDVGAEVANAFRPESLSALRELTLTWMANRAEEANEAATGSASLRESREVVLVALTGAPSAADVIRRAARVAERQRARLIGVHVRTVDGAVAGDAGGLLDEHRRLLTSLGGDYREVASGDVASALIDLASAENATQIVVGAPHRSRWIRLSRGSLISEVLERSPVDVHVVSPTRTGRPEPSRARRRRPTARSAFSPRRRSWSWAIAVAVPPAIAAGLSEAHPSLGLSAQLLLMVLGVTLAAVAGGTGPAAVAAVEAFVLSNWFFIPPLHELSVSRPEDAVSLVVFLVVAVAVGGYVSVSARRSAESLEARSQASTLAAMAGAVASSDDPLPAIVERLRDVYAAAGASLFVDDGGSTLVASAGVDAPANEDDAQLVMRVGSTCRLLLAGPSIGAADRATTTAFLDQLAVAVEQRMLRTARDAAEADAAANRLRAALLAAVSHDLRTPIAGVKASASTLLQPGLDLPTDVQRELLTSIDRGADRLTALVENLLDMSRIQAGVVEPHLAPTRLDEIVHRAATTLPRRPARVDIDLDDRLPSVLADGALLEHVVVNLVDNARKWAPDGSVVTVDAAEIGATVHLRVVDLGPGIPAAQRSAVREPFQRLDDSGRVEGTGLGLAVADGFSRAMGITLDLDDTPGGGLTATLVIPVAETAP